MATILNDLSPIPAPTKVTNQKSYLAPSPMTPKGLLDNTPDIKAMRYVVCILYCTCIFKNYLPYFKSELRVELFKHTVHRSINPIVPENILYIMLDSMSIKYAICTSIVSSMDLFYTDICKYTYI